MAINFLNTINFNQNELQNVVIDNAAAAPTTTEGAVYYNTDTDIMYYRNATSWVPMDGSGTGVTSFTNANGTFVSATTVNTTATGAVTMGSIDLSASGTAGATTFLRGDNTWAAPLGAYTSWTLEGDNVTTVGITDGLRVDFQGDTGITTAVTAGTPNVLTIDLDDTAVTPGSYTYSSITVDQQGRITAASSGSTPGTMSQWYVRDDDDDDQTVDNSKYLKFTAATGTAGTNLTGAGTTGDPYIMAITLPNDDTTYSMMTSSTLGLGKLEDDTTQTVAANSVTATASRTYGIQKNSSNQLVVNVPWVDTDDDTTYALSSTDGSNSADIVLTAGGSGSGTSAVTITGTGNETTIEEAGSTITVGLPDDVTITGELTVSGTGQSSIGGQLTIPTTPSAATDAASKGYVDGLVEGGLTFKGTFDANDGEIVSGSDSGSYLYNCPGGAGTRVAVVVGDYYVVATAGDFYCNSSYPMTIGDSIIGVSAASADASVVGDWSMVQSDEGVTDFTNANGTFVSASTVNSAATGSVTMGTIDLSATGSPGATTFLAGNNTWATPTDTTYSAATTGTLGLVKIEDGTIQTTAANAVTTTASRTYGLQFNSSDQLVVNVPWTDSDTTYSVATSSSLGLVKLEDDTTQITAANSVTATASRTYGLQLNSSNQGVVNVPWTDTDTTYVAMTSSTLGLGKLEDDTEQTVAANTVSSTASRTYGIQMNSSDQLVVNVPWTDTTGAVDSVTASSTNDEIGAIISPTTGAVIVGIDIKGTTNLGAEPATDDELLLYDTDGDVNKAVTIANLASAVVNRKGSRLALNTGTTNVTQQSGPPAGTEGWVVACDDEFGISSALDVMVEVITSGGETVYADVTRSGGDMTINFVGSGIAQGTYEAILSVVV